MAGYHNGSGSVAGDAALVAGNIRGGATIFGVAASLGTMPDNVAVNYTPGTSN